MAGRPGWDVAVVVGQLAGQVVAADEQEVAGAGGGHPRPGVAALALGTGNGAGLPVVFPGQVGGGDGVGAQPGGGVEVHVERAAHAKLLNAGDPLRSKCWL